MNSYLERALRAPHNVPSIAKKIEIKLKYTSAFKAHPHAEARREINLAAAGRIEPALHMGFFSWDQFDQRAANKVVYNFDPAGDLSIAIESPGLHSNALVGLLRQLVVRNHMTAASRRRQAERFEGVENLFTFDHLVQSIEIVQLEGAGLRQADLSHFVVDGPIRLPLGDAPWTAVSVNALMEVLTDADGIIAQRTGPAVDLGEGLLNEPMGILDMANADGWFTPLTELEQARSGDVEVFVRDEGDILFVNDYDGVYYGLVEFLNCISRNRVHLLRVDSQ